MTDPRNEYGQFSVVNKYGEPLAKKVIGVRLPQSVYDKLLELHPYDSGDWVRQAIINAVNTELTQKETIEAKNAVTQGNTALTSPKIAA